jgi:hypothetical protein
MYGTRHNGLFLKTVNIIIISERTRWTFICHVFDVMSARSLRTVELVNLFRPVHFVLSLPCEIIYAHFRLVSLERG